MRYFHTIKYSTTVNEQNANPNKNLEYLIMNLPLTGNKAIFHLYSRYTYNF